MRIAIRIVNSGGKIGRLAAIELHSMEVAFERRPINVGFVDGNRARRSLTRRQILDRLQRRAGRVREFHGR